MAIMDEGDSRNLPAGAAATGRLTVAHVSTQHGWHGGEEQARLLCEGLRARGHENLIFARAGGEFSIRMKSAEFSVQELPGGGRGPAAIVRMRAALRRRLPDVIHLHDSHALTGGGLACVGLNIPARIAARRVDFPIRSAWRYRWFSNHVVPVSTTVAEACCASGIDRSRITIVHDGVDPDRASSGDRRRGRASLGIADDKLLLVTVATLTEAKGHRDLLAALKTVVKRFPQVIAVCAGDGELRGPLETEVARLELQPFFRFLGYRSDVPDLLRAADLMVMPSVQEGLCSTLIDAMFAGTPIITTTAGGIPDLVGPCGDGAAVARMVPPQNPSALAEAVSDALQALAEGLPIPGVDPLRANDRAWQHFTAEAMVEGTLTIYRRVLESAKQR